MVILRHDDSSDTVGDELRDSRVVGRQDHTSGDSASRMPTCCDSEWPSGSVLMDAMPTRQR